MPPSYTISPHHMSTDTMTHSSGIASRTRSMLMWIITAIVGLSFGVLFFLQPDTTDECWYKLSMLSYIKDPSLSTFFESVWNCCRHHYLYDNGRLANVVGAVLLLMPRWLSAIILGSAVAYCTALSARIAGIWRKSLPAYIALVFLWVFALPWNDKMLTLVFSYNYICGAALSLMLLAFTLSDKKMSVGAYFALALVTGLWHEGFSGPMLCAIAALAVVHRRYRNKRIVAIALGLALGITYLWLAPGTDCRNEFLHVGFGNGLRDLRLGWYYGVVCYASIAIILLRSFSRRSRHTFASSPTLIAMLVTMLAAWGVWRYFMFGPRTAFACTVFAIVLFVALTAGRLRLRRQRRHHSAIRRYAIVTISLACCAIIAGNITASIIGVANVRKCCRIMAEQYSKDPDRDIYIPLKMPWQLSPWTFGKVETQGFLHKLTYTFYRAYYYDLHATVGVPRPVPIGLKGFTPNKAKEIGIGAYKAYIFGHVIVFDTLDCVFSCPLIAYHFGDKISEYPNLVIPFFGADGKEYVYVVPNGCINEALLYGGPTAVELIPPHDN